MRKLAANGDTMTNDDALTVTREPVSAEELADLGVNLDRDFPDASAEEFRRFPVLSEGWYMVVKHQPNLISVSRQPWHPLGPISLTSIGLVASRQTPGEAARQWLKDFCKQSFAAN
jgi:hypothetical protein